MAFRYPPPGAQVAAPFTPVMNFNIPPPGFRPPYYNEAHNQGTYFVQSPSSDGFTNKNIVEPHVADKPFSIAEYVQDVMKKRKCFGYLPKKPTTPSLKICEARKLLQMCLNDLDELQSLQKDLNSSYQDLNPALWKEKWDHIKRLKFQVHNSMERLNNPESLGTLKKLLLKQTKKRRRQKRKREEYQEMKADYRIRRQHIDKSIDNWLKDMQDVVERAKREESLKHEADQVLSEVTRKKAEARKQLNMLKALEKLRRIRAQTAIRRGEHISAETGDQFEKVIEHLLKLWNDQMKEYEVEEQGLRVMLEEAVDERTKSEVSQIKQVLRQWELLLFGRQQPVSDFYQAAERNMESFIEIRKSWDTFIAHPGAVVSSSIPIGWVVPTNPTSEKWAALLTKDT